MSDSEFKISPRRRLILLTTAGFFISIPTLLAISSIITKDSSIAAAAGIVLCIMLPFAAYMFFCAWYPRLKVCSDGLELRGIIGFAPFKVRWEQIERIRLLPGSEAFILNQAIQTRASKQWANWSGVSYRGAPMYDQEQRELINQARYVPFEAFAWWLENGSLLQTLKNHIPEKLENYSQQIIEAKELRSKNRRVLQIVFSGSAVVIILAIYAGLCHPDWLDDPQVGSIAMRLIDLLQAVIALGLFLHALVNTIAAIQFVKKRSIGLAIFWLIAAVIQVLLSVSILASIANHN